MKTLVRFGSSQNLLPASEQRELVREAATSYLLSEQQFPTGGIVRERDVRMNR